MKRILTIALILAAFSVIVSLVYRPLQIPSLTQSNGSVGVRTLELSGTVVRVEVSDTPEKREKGLSSHNELAPDEGMLFIFPEDGHYAFWMKDMNFPIDILWISREGIIVDIRQKVSPETYPTAFVPRKEARYVLELPSGFVEKYNTALGDQVRL